MSEAPQEPLPAEPEHGAESTLTVIIALLANALVAVAKSVAAVVTGSASMVAEAAHSWADTGNEVLLLVADRRARRPADAEHPLGYGKDAYVWSMFAALGLFGIGAGVSITHGIGELTRPEPSSDFLVAYIVLGVSLVLEGISFTQAYRQTRREAQLAHRDVLSHAFRTSDPTTRAVFAEDAAALIGIVIAGTAILVHQLTGWTQADAIGSILVGILLGIVSVILISRNRQFLIGEGAPQRLFDAVQAMLQNQPEIERVTYLRLEFLGPRQLMLIAAVDLVGNDTESATAQRLRELTRRIEQDHSEVRRAFISLALSGDPTLR